MKRLQKLRDEAQRRYSQLAGRPGQGQRRPARPACDARARGLTGLGPARIGQLGGELRQPGMQPQREPLALPEHEAHGPVGPDEVQDDDVFGRHLRPALGSDGLTGAEKR